MGVSQNRLFMQKNPIKMDDLGVPLFQETSICLRLVCCMDLETPPVLPHSYVAQAPARSRSTVLGN